VAILLDAGEPLAVAGYGTYEAPARALQIELRSLEVRGPNPDLDAAIKAALEWPADALVVVSSTLLFPYRKAIADLALKWRLPTAFHGSDWVAAGGLMSYSADDLAAFRRAAYYIDRILKGAKPRDLPVEQPTTFRLVINQRTASALGLVVPSALLAFADEVIEAPRVHRAARRRGGVAAFCAGAAAGKGADGRRPRTRLAAARSVLSRAARGIAGGRLFRGSEHQTGNSKW
jgi:putative ABC transport system substrate-binding protein